MIQNLHYHILQASRDSKPSLSCFAGLTSHKPSSAYFIGVARLNPHQHSWWNDYNLKQQHNKIHSDKNQFWHKHFVAFIDKKKKKKKKRKKKEEKKRKKRDTIDTSYAQFKARHASKQAYEVRAVNVTLTMTKHEP